jgi:hypothetical protein
MGVLALWPRLHCDSPAKGIALHTRCPLVASPIPAPALQPSRPSAPQPSLEATHLLLGNRAFLIREDKPLVIGLADNAPAPSPLVGYRAGAMAKLCAILTKHQGQIVVENKGENAIFIDDQQVNGRTALVRGQTLTIAGFESPMRLIACVDQDDETARY